MEQIENEFSIRRRSAHFGTHRAARTVSPSAAFTPSSGKAEAWNSLPAQ